MPATAEKPKMKSTKPLMEKRRRARINDSLMQLKSLVLDALNKNNPRHSKLEKADILEMTVRYLRMIQRQQISASVNSNPAKLGQYRSGYAECVNEVTRYLDATSATERTPELQTQLVGHLANLCTSPKQQQQSSSPTRTPSPPQHHQRQTPYPQYATPIQHQYQQAAEQVYADTAISPSVDHTRSISYSPEPEGARVEYALTAPVYDTQRLGMSPPANSPPPHPQGATRVVVTPPTSGVTTLPSGEITVVLPSEALQNGQLPTHFIPVYAPTQGQVVVTTPTANLHSANVSLRSVSPSSGGNSLPVSPVAARTSPVHTSPVQQQSPVSSPVTPQYHHHQAQTELSPESRELYYQNLDLKEALYENHCVAKRDAMWRPW